MTSKTSKTTPAAAAAPAAAPAAAAPAMAVADLLTLIADLTAEKEANRQIRKRTPIGFASKVAAALNSRGVKCQGEDYWTGPRILAYVAKHSA